ncbi:MAG: hypothetical protein ACK4GD_04285 [Sphingomonadaceae bacterium]
MKNLSRTIVLGCGLVILTGCGADEIVSPGTGGNITINNPAAPPPPPPPPPASVVTPAGACPTITDPQGLTDRGTISGPTGTYRVCEMPARFNVSTTLPYIPGLLYFMNGRVDVGTDGGPTPDASDGATDTNVVLTIEPGVIAYARGASFLMVNRGNRINAVGTPARPIIFTSQDNVAGFNGENSSGQWGGVVLAGRAPTTDCRAPGATPGSIQCERQVEGAAQPALFGGATNNDNSGVMRYVQIRYSGFVLSGDSELQSLTTGGTGTGTQFSHIMSYNSSDDGVEFFGGFVNMKNLIVVGSEDDSLDVDTGVKANLQYVIVAQRAAAADGLIEGDSTNALIDNTPRTDLQLSNATMIQRRNNDHAVRLRGGMDASIVNTIIVDASEAGTPCLRIDDAQTIRAATPGLDEKGPPVFRSTVMTCRTPFRAGGGGVTLENTQSIFNAGTNNNANFTSTLTMTFVNGANEAAVPVFNPTALSSFFDAVTYIGAVRDANDRWYEGWTCNSAALNLGTNTGACTSLPVYS